ncbi:AAA family ATPase [Clostridium polynesiense]|uniref:AAA family ATPase n=1 Tax=Clostridium polynesiense TaxID=1325933 RepID=UPI00058E5720|nr:AAA family ATPase [Clostridium polynesiense]
MNFTETLQTVELIIKSGEVPLIVGESGIGKTSLVKSFSEKHGYYLITIDANLLKEGEIGGLPTIDEIEISINGLREKKKRTVYAAHTKLIEINEVLNSGKADKVLLFIDEINRCEHSVQQELMNLILNREINGYKLPHEVRVVAAMNPSNRYHNFQNTQYQVVDMDPAQEDRFVWIYLDSEVKEWIKWAMSKEGNIHEHVIEFISAFPEYLHTPEAEDNIKATPRSFERVSKAYRIFKESKGSIPINILYNAVKGNVGKEIAQDFISFIGSYKNPMINPLDILESGIIAVDTKERILKESHSRLFIFSKNMLNLIEERGIKEEDIEIFSRLLGYYPSDLRIGIMKGIKSDCSTEFYNAFLDNEEFIQVFFESYA